MGGGLEESFLRNIQGVRSNGFDSIGRILSPELQEKVSYSLMDKIKGLFFKNKDGDSVVSIGDIVKQIEKDFGVPISTGRFRQKAYGIYKNKTEAIRTKVSNALLTIAHEMGHHIDKRYGLRTKKRAAVVIDHQGSFYIYCYFNSSSILSITL